LTPRRDTPRVIDDPSRPTVTFIVRASRDERGQLRGIVERARTGAKERFSGAPGVGGLIDRMLDGDPMTRKRPRRRTP
jgi:hypothetical protein